MRLHFTCQLCVKPHPPSIPSQFFSVPQGKISRDDIADLCVELLDIPAAVGTTFEIKSTVPFSQPWGEDDKAAQQPRDWAAAITGAALVPGVTGKTVNGVYSGKRPEAEVAKEAAVVKV